MHTHHQERQPREVKHVKRSRESPLQPTRDAALVDALIGVIGHLRTETYGRLSHELWPLRLDASTLFLERFETHLTEEEHAIFPGLAEVAPLHATQLERLKNEHASLREKARDLSARIEEGDTTQAIEDARSLLSQLLDHMKREEQVVQHIIDSLDENDLKRLGRFLPVATG